jgi:glycosyltransferase involved in cell wall biosynthesis
VVEEVRAHLLPVMLVDDGSAAGCAAVLDRIAAADPGVRLLRLPLNRGKGAAVLSGVRVALADGFSHAVQIDADGQHDTSAIPEALDLARRHPRALVAGVPVFDANIPRSRLYGRWFTHVFVWLNTWSLSLRDALCGFRVYPLPQTAALAARQKIRERMDFDIDIAVRLVWDNLPVYSVPVAVSYPADGVSHFDLWRDNLRISRTHARLLAGMLVRSPLLLWRRLTG